MPQITKPFHGRQVRGRSPDDGFTMDPGAYYRRVVGNRIRELREKAGLTQRELGKALGVGNTYVSAIELGQTTISPERYADFADVLNVAPSTFGKFLLRNYDPWLYGLIYGEKVVEADLQAIRPRIRDTRTED